MANTAATPPTPASAETTRAVRNNGPQSSNQVAVQALSVGNAPVATLLAQPAAYKPPMTYMKSVG